MNYQNLIGGDWTQASSGKTFDDVNPADTRDIVGRFQASTAVRSKYCSNSPRRAA